MKTDTHETTVEMVRPGLFEARCSCGWRHPKTLPSYLAHIEAYAHRNPGWRKETSE